MKRKLVLSLLVTTMMLSVAGCANNGTNTKTTPTPVATATTTTQAPVVEEGVSKIEGYANAAAFVTPEQAKELLGANDKVVVFDIRKGSDYKDGHIVGAINLFREQYESKAYEYGGMAMAREDFEKLLGECGVASDSKVLVYGGNDNLDSARFAWMLKMYGHENVSLIDGGIKGWETAGFETTKEVPTLTPASFKFAAPENKGLIASLDEVKAAVETKDSNVIILDTRSDGEYNGKDKKKGAFRKGRIPGAVHIEYKNVVGENGFKTKEEIQKIYEAAGVTADKTIIPYCQSGVRSANTAYVLREILGYKNVKNYDGSWIEWSFNKDLPIE